jgi:hypothetical protein
MLHILKYIFLNLTEFRSFNAQIGLNFDIRSARKFCVKAILKFNVRRVGRLQKYDVIIVRCFILKIHIKIRIYKILLSLRYHNINSWRYLTILKMATCSLFFSFTFDYIWSQVCHNSHNTRFVSIIRYKHRRILIVAISNYAAWRIQCVIKQVYQCILN